MENEEEPTSVFRERFLKINVKHITDGEGVVAGVLLVTPNAVMFDPNVSDPLVSKTHRRNLLFIATRCSFLKLFKSRYMVHVAQRANKVLLVL